jgi:hypothetical protein
LIGFVFQHFLLLIRLEFLSNTFLRSMMVNTPSSEQVAISPVYNHPSRIALLSALLKLDGTQQSLRDFQNIPSLDWGLCTSVGNPQQKPRNKSSPLIPGGTSLPLSSISRASQPGRIVPTVPSIKGSTLLTESP